MLLLLYLFIIFSYITLLPLENPHAVATDIGIAVKPIPVGDKVIELDVVAIKTSVSNDFNIVFNVVYFLDLFFDLLFSSLKYVMTSLMLLIVLLKELKSFKFFLIFVLNHYFLTGQMGTIYLFFVPFIWHKLNKFA